MSLAVKLRIPNRVQPDVIPFFGSVGVYTNKMHYMRQQLLEELPSKPFALDFMQPVDSDALKVPTYYTIIQWPMDLGTIMKRLQNLYYQSVEDLISDFRLILRNCYTFNRPGDIVYRNGQKLERFFLRILKNMPEGPEMPLNRDPRAPCSPPNSQRTTAFIERKCREQLKKLQASNAEHSDADFRDLLKEKLSGVSKQLSKHQFKIHEDFKLELDIMLLKSCKRAKGVFEGIYQQSLDSVGQLTHQKELSQLFFLLQKNDDCARLEQKPQTIKWEDSLVDCLDTTVKRFKDKLEACRLEEEEEEAEQARLKKLRAAEREKKRAKSKRSYSTINDKQLSYVSEAERRTIQQQFLMLPTSTKIEIMRTIAQRENISVETTNLEWFDIKNFSSITVNMMKKAMYPHTKLNLRNMKPAEKENLQRCLENRLQNINQVLNRSRRKYTQRLQARSTAPARKRARISTNSQFDVHNY
ncbi:bromodomain testis-specific protein [Drosophila navojoa]|uniref:bromodomain testis-specific protein n=1 Tax=Drosophila navojoa TaxID=7232 RepID=UPI0011BDDA5D|nr:bromodomain testis-specific protein [Drosophila navojoa]